MVRHHPSDATLFAYGGGTLGEAFSLVVATHLTVCAECRRRVADIEAVGGALLDEIEPAPLEDDAFDRLALRLDEVAEAAPPGRVPVARPNSGDLPPPLLSYLSSLSDARWRRVFPGIDEAELLPTDSHGDSARLLRVRPGMALARHTHEGRESTVVLTGAFHDELGHFGPGDVAELDDSTVHRPVGEDGTDCVCLVALDGSLRFTGVLARMLRPLFGF
jgi:putative transcriptional regulator